MKIATNGSRSVKPQATTRARNGHQDKPDEQFNRYDVPLPKSAIKDIQKRADKLTGGDVSQYLATLAKAEISRDEFMKKYDEDMTRFGKWIQQAPPVGEYRPTATIELTLELQDWMFLASAAATHRTDVNNVIAYFLTCHGGGLCEWSSEFRIDESFDGMDDSLLSDAVLQRLADRKKAAELKAKAA